MVKQGSHCQFCWTFSIICQWQLNGIFQVSIACEQINSSCRDSAFLMVLRDLNFLKLNPLKP